MNTDALATVPARCPTAGHYHPVDLGMPAEDSRYETRGYASWGDWPAHPAMVTFWPTRELAERARAGWDGPIVTVYDRAVPA